jgi:hypothetical protein
MIIACEYFADLKSKFASSNRSSGEAAFNGLKLNRRVVKKINKKTFKDFINRLSLQIFG